MSYMVRLPNPQRGITQPNLQLFEIPVRVRTSAENQFAAVKMVGECPIRGGVCTVSIVRPSASYPSFPFVFACNDEWMNE